MASGMSSLEFQRMTEDEMKAAADQGDAVYKRQALPFKSGRAAKPNHVSQECFARTYMLMEKVVRPHPSMRGKSEAQLRGALWNWVLGDSEAHPDDAFKRDLAEWMQDSRMLWLWASKPRRSKEEFADQLMSLRRLQAARSTSTSNEQAYAKMVNVVNDLIKEGVKMSDMLRGEEELTEAKFLTLVDMDSKLGSS